MSCCNTSYTASATATASTIANSSETVTASSSATASSTLSVSDAYSTALSIANSVALSTAQTDANILNQSFLKTIALGNNYTVPDNSNYYYIKGDSTSSNIPTFFPLTTSTIYASAVDSKGNLYVGGSFSTIPNVNGLTSSDNLTTVFNNIAMWNGKTWSQVGYGIIGAIYAITIDSSDNVYVGGIFSAIPDYASNTAILAYNIAKWNGSVWSVLGTTAANGTSSTVYAIAIDSNNNIYVGGLFSYVNYTGSATGSTVANNIAKWSGSSWTTLGTGTTSTGNGTNAIVYALAIDSSNNVYVGGNFTSVYNNATTSAYYIAKWSGSSWTTLGTGTTSTGNGTNGAVFALAIDSNNNVYVGGSFTIVDSSSSIIFANFIALWNNVNWTSIGGPNNGYINGLSSSFSTNKRSLTLYNNNIYVNGYKLYSDYINISYNNNIVAQLYLNGQSVNVYASNNNGNKLCSVITPTRFTQNYF